MFTLAYALGSRGDAPSNEFTIQSLIPVLLFLGIIAVVVYWNKKRKLSSQTKISNRKIENLDSKEERIKLKEASWAWKLPLIIMFGSVIIKSAIKEGLIPFGGYGVFATDWACILLYIISIKYIHRAWKYEKVYGYKFDKHAVAGTIIVGLYFLLLFFRLFNLF